MAGFLIVIIIIGVLAYAFREYKRKRRREQLFVKYGDTAVVERLMNRQVWQGMSKAQLIDSLGKPTKIDTKIQKTKSTEIYKYNQTGKNRFGRKIQIDNGLVTGWEDK